MCLWLRPPLTLDHKQTTLPKKAVMTRLVLWISVTLLLACAPRGIVTLAPDAAGIGEIQRIFIGTTRQQEQDGQFGSGRSEKVNFARFDVSVPPNRELGEINWPPRRGKADPTKHFVTTDEIVYQTGGAFRAALHQELAAEGGEAVIFVHGYNNNFSEGVYRIAQFAHDLKISGAIVHYAWPSAAEPLGYVYDRDSALFSRDGLEQLIDEVAAAGAKKIILVAHSMGSSLAVEALRQAAIRGDHKNLGLIGGVILISPDIDIDVFKQNARAIGRLPQPFVIFSSDRDRFLRVSALMTGQTERLGSVTDLRELAELEVTLMDVGEFSEGAGHFTVADSPVLLQLLAKIQQVEGAFEADRRARIGVLPGVVMTVQNATQVVLRPVAQVASEINR